MRDKVNPGDLFDLQIKVDEAVEDLNRLADFLADSTECAVGQTDAIERVHRIIASLVKGE